MLARSTGTAAAATEGGGSPDTAKVRFSKAPAAEDQGAGEGADRWDRSDGLGPYRSGAGGRVTPGSEPGGREEPKELEVESAYTSAVE